MLKSKTLLYACEILGQGFYTYSISGNFPSYTTNNTRCPSSEIGLGFNFQLNDFLFQIHLLVMVIPNYANSKWLFFFNLLNV